MANLRAGMVGIGSMGKNHVRNLRAIDGVDLVAIADASGKDPFGVAGDLPVLPDVDAVIEAGVDYCVVAAPTKFHEEIGLKLAEAGVHALIEKPLAYDTAAATRLAKAFESKGLIGAVGHIERYNPALQSLRKRLENGDLGDLYQVATRRQGPFPARIADVGVVKDLASHDIDLTAWVTQREFELVAARTMSNHLVNWLTPTKERRTFVTGEKGMFIADTLTADLTFYSNAKVATVWDDIANFRGVAEGDVTRFAIPKPEPLRTEHENFRDAVLGKGSDIVTMTQGAKVVQVCEAMINSAASGEFVKIS